jgi:riboflavin kinase/FMN adenylyltransferase
MKVFNNLSDLPKFRNAVVTIGSFDGVHHGHQKILERVKLLARECDGESIVITFHPHPRLLLYPDDPSLRLLNTIDEKVALLEKNGIDNVVVVPFTAAFAQQNPDSYIQNFLIQKFEPKYIVIGYDHRFGKNRAGNIDYLRRYEKAANFKIVDIEKQEVEDIAVSSTKIRKALEFGDIKTATHLLGHAYTFSGTVVKGQGIGKSLGYPTANIELKSKHKLIPHSGIYAVKAILNTKPHDALLYIGKRPTIQAYNNKTIEVHLLDFDKDIYGDKLTVEFVDLIRGDIEFESVEKLKEQMKKDELEGRKILSKKNEPGLLKQSKATASVAVVILNFNGKKLMEKFLPSVNNTSYQNTELIIADNCSNDDSIEFLKRKYSKFKIIQLSVNHGFAKGYNEALKLVKADYYVLLNSDVEVGEGWIEPVIELMEADSAIGVCQPKVLAFNNKKLFEHAGACGGLMDQWGYPFCKGRIFETVEIDTGQYDQVEEIFWASGAAMFIRSDLFHKLGGFDEDYYAHHEEIDLCWRIKRAGYKVMVQPKSVVYHLGGGTLDYQSPRKTYLNFRNSLFNIVKNEAPSKLFWLIPLRLILDGLAGFLFLIKGKFSHIRSILKAHISFYKSYFKYVKKRAYYNDLIEKNSISIHANRKGIFNGSIIWSYYVLRKKFYKNLER